MYLVIYLLVIGLSLLWYITKPLYWKGKNIPYLIPLPIFGNILPMLKECVVNSLMELHNKFPGHKYFGMHFLWKPTLFIKDPTIINNILVRDSNYFASHGFYSNQDRDPAGANVFHINGQQWREMRVKLNQYFTPGKVKAMLCCVHNTMEKLTAELDKNIEQDEQYEMNGLLHKATNDIITQAIFGIETDIFNNENSLFIEFSNTFLRIGFTAKLMLSVTTSYIYDLLKLTIFHKKFYISITRLINDTMDYRKKNNIYRQDFLQGMMELLDKEQVVERKYFPDNTRVPVYNMNTVMSQAMALHSAAVETTTLAMTFFLYEMALNPEIQTKCRNEVNSVVNNDEPLSVDHLSKLPYLTAAIKETIRIYPPLILINRKCTQEYKFPDSNLVIEPGTFVLMSIRSLHMNEDYFPEPKIFRPERFIDEEKNKITPGTYFPFGLGPRTCIGMLFAYGEMKLILGRLLQQYEFHVCSKTQIPVECQKYLVFSKPVKGMWLKIKPVKLQNKN